MADYNVNEIDRMRREAMRRMQEMQRRAQGFRPPPPPETAPPVAPPPGGEPGHRGGLFELAGIAIDEEKAMIAMLIYILYKQGADIKLLLALGYLLI